MSEDRIPENSFTFRLARNRGKIIHGKRPQVKVEMFGAHQFSRQHSRAKRNFSPRLPSRPTDQQKFYGTMYRLRINGVWYVPGQVDYTFFTKLEVIEFLLGNLR